MTDLMQYAPHLLGILSRGEDLLLDDDRQRIRDITVAALENLWGCPAADEMGLTQLFAGHLKEQELVALRRDRFRVLLVEFPCLEIGVGLASVSEHPVGG